MIWTDERCATLEKLWAEGLSASQAAKRIGGGLTRNAVIGKVHRMGLAPRATTSRKRSTRTVWRKSHNLQLPKRPAPGRPKSTGFHSNFNAFLSSQSATPEPLPKFDPHEVGTVSILDVRDDQCKFIPINHHLCCGTPSVKGLPYCEAHALRCLRSPVPQRGTRVELPVLQMEPA